MILQHVLGNNVYNPVKNEGKHEVSGSTCYNNNSYKGISVIKEQPNILLIFTDQQRFDTIQSLGSNFNAKTPSMDFLVQEGAAFDNCFCTAPICSPSRATMMTGLYPSQVGMPGNLYDPCPPLSPTISTVGNHFRSAGYETVYHGKWHMGGGDIRHYGFEKGEELYDLGNDKHETCNLADSEEHETIKSELKQQLDQHITEAKDPFYELDKHNFIMN